MLNISIVILGQHHEDPLPLAALIQTIRAIPQTVPVGLCREGASTSNTIAGDIDFLKEITEKNQELLSSSPLKEFFDKTRLKRGTFPINTRDVALKIFQLLGNTKDMFCFLQHHAAYVELLNLLSLAKERAIPYYNMDLPAEQMPEIYKSLDNAKSEEEMHKILYANEKRRIEAMTNILWRQVGKMKNTGGIIFVAGLGLMHTDRLAANIKRKFAADIASEKITLNIFSIIATSPYISYLNPDEIKQEMERFKSQDSSEMIAIYKTMPTTEIFFDEDKNSGQATSRKFTDVIDNALALACMQRIYIPNFNDKKREVLNALGAKILEMLLETNDAFVEVRSDKLIKDIRDKLEIAKVSAELSNYEKQLAALQADPMISIQKTLKPTTVLLTFPIAKKDFVETVIFGPKQQIILGT